MDDARETSSPCAGSGGAQNGSATDLRPSVWVVAFILATLLLLVVGCGTSGTTSSGNASAASSKACQSIGTINQSLTQLSTAGDNTTVGQVKPIQQKLTTALNALDKLPNGGGSALSSLKSANDQLATAISNLPDSAPVSQASSQFQNLKGKVSQAQAAATKLTSTLHCTA